MSSVFIRIAEALTAALSNPPIPQAGPAQRERLSPIGQQTSFAITVSLEKTQGTPAGATGSPRDWATDFAVECMARVPDVKAVPSDVVDPLLCAVYARLANASTDPVFLNLGVMEVLPDPAITWDSGDAQTQQIVVTLSVRVIHRTSFASLEKSTP